MPSKKEPLSTIAVKTLLAILLFAGIGTIVVGGGWLVGKHKKVSEPVKKDTVINNDNDNDNNETEDKIIVKDETKNEAIGWQKYVNSKYGYSIEYPDSLYIETENSENDYTERGPNKEYIGGDTAWSNYPGFNYTPGNIPKDYWVITLMIYKVDVNKSIDNFIKEKHFEGDVENSDFPTNDGIIGKQYVFVSADHPVGLKSVVTFFKKNDRIYVFNSSWKIRDIYNQIISTFKFIEKDE